MKNLILQIIMYLCSVGFLNAQIVNVNPDPTGSPWIAEDASMPSSEVIESVPILELSAQAAGIQLPEVVDNSQLIFMPPVNDQLYANSCIQFAEIWYTFTYEINRKRGLAAGNLINKLNLYHPHFTYNFLNNGNPASITDYYSGFKIIKENGCPSYDIYDDPALDDETTKYKYWMTDYENYYSGMQNRIAGYSNIHFAANFTTLKHWLANHFTGASTGGLAIIAVYNNGWNVSNTFPPGSPEAGKKLVTQWGPPTNYGHALTLVGYNNNVFYDLNQNGIIDQNEFGAFKAVNSAGLGFGNDGYIYIPYELMKSGLQWSNTAYVCHVDTEVYEPELSIKASVEHNDRSKLKFIVGYADNASQTIPIDTSGFQSFKYQGGPWSMRGAYTGPIEIGLDFGYWYLNHNPGKVFFEVRNNSTNNGTIEYFSIVDRRWDEVFELFCDQTNVTIINNGTTTLAIDYHLLPHEQPVTSDLDITSNRVSRFITTVANNAILSINDGVRIDMYDSEIMINSGSTVILEDNVTFLAKKGHCKIIIDGEINIGSNLNFLAEGEATLELILLNPNIIANFNSANFEQAGIVNHAQILTISNSTFNQYPAVQSYLGDVTINSSTFNESGIYLANQSRNTDLTVNVSGNIFIIKDYSVAIDVLNYGKYFIENNNIKANHYGIQISNSGDGNTGNQIIFNNNIHNCNMAGIIAYNVTGSIAGNYIYDNQVGIKLMNSCNIALYGNGAAQNQEQTQRIKDNISYEIYSSKYSFPWYFRYNVIIDEDNFGNPFDPLLYWAYPDGRVDQKDIRYNCWGNNFSASADLYPSAYFNYNPIWCPGNPAIIVDPLVDLYDMGTEQFENGNYATAKSTFQLLIQQYPKSDYAQAAMKELVRLEEYVASDYISLKNFLLTSDSIVADTILSALAEILANKCDIKLENWQQAIDWLENRISNPTCLEDSIFGIIDLGYVYLLMENQNLKSAYTGNLKQFKPETKAEFFDHRDYLLSLLPGEMMHDKDRKNLTSPYGSLLHNVPNPFTENTQIWYRIETKSNVAISISDLTGKEIQKIVAGEKDKGTYHIDFLRSNLSSGAYFYTLILDGRKCDTRKMIIMK